jgi:hypothetical protein
MQVPALDLSGFCEHVDERLGSIKCGEFLHEEGNY